MAKTPTTGKTAKIVGKAAAKKASASKAKAKLKTVKAAEDVEAKKPKARAAKTPKPAADDRIVTMHGETRINHAGDADAARMVEAIGRLVDEIHALGRVRITSAAHFGGTTTLHVVLPDHVQPYDSHPGIILTIGETDNQVSFDHVAIGRVSPDLVNDASLALLVAIRSDEDNPANAVGRRADWYEQAVIAAEGVADQYVSA